MRLFRLLSTAAAVVTYALVVLGGVVRVSGSGLGCPDWPLCHGRLLPPLQLHVLIEYSHRSAATLASVLIAVSAAWAWVGLRQRADLRLGATASLALLIVQVGLGAVTVLFELPSAIVLAHLATAMLLLGVVCLVAAAAWLDPVPAGERTIRRWALAAAGATYGLILSGSLVTATAAGSACAGWPLCGGGLTLSADRLPLVQLFHRGTAAGVGLLVVVSLVMVLRRLGWHRGVRIWAALTLTALVLQVAVGAAVVWLHLPAALRGLHLALAAAVWAGTVILVMLTRRMPGRSESMTAGSAERRQTPRLREVVLDYASLAKPRIIALLLVTALGGMMIAQRGWPSTGLVLLTLLGGALAAAGAGAINCWIDRDIDRAMVRTRQRPLPGGRIAPAHALTFGITLGVVSFLVLAFGVNVLAATLAAAGLLIYVFVYSLWLKRSTPQNIVIGGAAGAMPPLVGWAAVTQSLDLTAIYLFAIIVFWTPPHFWALALRTQGDYARARVPMLPVVVGDRQARWQILGYTLLLVAVSLMLFATRSLGWIYLGGAVALGAGFLLLAGQTLRDRSARWSRRLFDYSIVYLAALFSVMVIDRMVIA